MSTQESGNLSGKSGAGLAALVFLGTRIENVPDIGGQTIFVGPYERIVAFPLPAEAVQAAVTAVAKAPDLRYASVATEVFDPNEPEHAINQAKAIAAFAQRGQIVVSLATHDLARHTLPAEYSFESIGPTYVSTGSVEHLFFALHPSLVAREVKPAPRVATRRTTLFIGRTRELEEVRRQMDLSRVVTVIGPSGIGKSAFLQRLTTEIDNEFPDGVGKIDLSTVSQPAFIAPALVRLLEAPKLAGEEHLDALVAYLRPRRFLLVLDNAERMIGEVRRIVTTLVDACPDLGLIVGSQKPLRIAGEARYRLEGLDVPSIAEDWQAMLEYDAVALFVDRAELVDTKFRFEPSNASDIAALCLRLDGIPLAIELAAAKTKLLSPKQILGRLNDRFTLLKDKDSGKTLFATVDWGYNHLRPEDQSLLRRLAVFSGAFTVDQAIEVCTDDAISETDVLAAFEELVDSSMIATSTVSGGPKRFHLTETVRQYARDRLKESGEQPLYLQRHREWCLRFTDQVEKGLAGRDQLSWLTHLDASYQDVRSAIEWHLTRKGDASIAVRMTLGMHRYFFLRHYLTEGFRLASMIAETRSAEDVPGIARLLNLTAMLAHLMGDEETASEYAVRSMWVARRHKDLSGLARARNSLALIAESEGRMAKGRRYFLGALKAFRELNEKDLLLRVLMNTSGLETWMGLLDSAREHLSEAEVLVYEHPEPYLRIYFHQSYAHLCLAEGIPISALRHCRETLRMLQSVQNPASGGICLRNVAYAYDMLQQHETSAIFLGMAQSFSRYSEQKIREVEREKLNALEGRLIRILGAGKFEKRLDEGLQFSIEAAVTFLEGTIGP